MITYNYKTAENNICVNVGGHMDTAACVEFSTFVEKLIADHQATETLTVDAQQLDFISSTGLRLMLRLRKYFHEFSIVNASQDVYSVFEMTGFTKMMHIEKALRTISIEGCPEIGRGGVGVVYRLTDDSIIKVFREGTDRQDVDIEINMAKEAFVLGMPTAISYDVVKVGNQFGLVYEMLNAQTLSTIIANDPDNLETYARQFAELYRQMHEIEVPEASSIPNACEHELWALNKIRHYVGDEIVEQACKIVESLPKGNSLLHCDLHPKNVMVQNGELMLIDMGEVSYGNPIIDLAHTCSSMKHLVGDYKGILGLTEEQAHRFYSIMLDEYYKDVTAEEKAQNIELIERMSIVRGISWLSLSDNFPQELVDASRECFLKRI